MEMTYCGVEEEEQGWELIERDCMCHMGEWREVSYSVSIKLLKLLSWLTELKALNRIEQMTGKVTFIDIIHFCTKNLSIKGIVIHWITYVK